MWYLARPTCSRSPEPSSRSRHWPPGGLSAILAHRWQRDLGSTKVRAADLRRQESLTLTAARERFRLLYGNVLDAPGFPIMFVR